MRKHNRTLMISDSNATSTILESPDTWWDEAMAGVGIDLEERPKQRLKILKQSSQPRICCYQGEI